MLNSHRDKVNKIHYSLKPIINQNIIRKQSDTNNIKFVEAKLEPEIISLVKLQSKEINKPIKIITKTEEFNLFNQPQEKKDNNILFQNAFENNNLASFKELNTLTTQNKLTQSLFMKQNDLTEKCNKNFQKANSQVVPKTSITYQFDFNNDNELKTYLVT